MHWTRCILSEKMLIFWTTLKLNDADAKEQRITNLLAAGR